MAISVGVSAPYRIWAISDEQAEAIGFVGGQNDSRRPHAVISKGVLVIDQHPPVHISAEIKEEEEAR